MQALVLLKWAIGLVPETSIRIMAFTIIVRWNWQVAKNGYQSKIELKKNMVFKSILVTSIISICHNFYLSCKSNHEVAHSENHPPGVLTADSPKTKKSIAGFRAACATNRKSTEGISSCAVAKKQETLTSWLDLAVFIQERGVSEATLSSLILLRSRELLARRIFLWTC